MLIANSCKSEYFTSQDSYTMSVMKQFKFLLPWNGYSLAPLNIQPFCITGTIWSRDGCLWGVLLYFDNWVSDKYLLLDIIFIILISYSMQGTWMKIMVNMFATRLQSRRLLMTTLPVNWASEHTFVASIIHQIEVILQTNCPVTSLILKPTDQVLKVSGRPYWLAWRDTRICKHIIERFGEHCKYAYSIYSNGPEDAKCPVEGRQ